MLTYQNTPVQRIVTPFLTERNIQLLVKREDMNHPLVSGNKWWKLKYNLTEAKRLEHHTVLTFGGAYSNHIFSTAAAAKACNLKSIGIIRGEETYPLNPTLAFAKSQGMQLHYVSREAYRNKHSPDWIEKLHQEFGAFYLIPEGGTNAFAVKGCSEFVAHFNDIDFDSVCVPVGTAGTIAGLLCGLQGDKRVIGVPVFKQGEFLFEEINTLVKNYSGRVYGNLDLLTSYHHGGYAKVSTALIQFILQMKSEHDLPLDPVYTGKLLFAICEEIKKGYFAEGSTILAIHTGGLQGANTILEKYGKTSN